ncbi:Crp/Fnr family transcriptional regulator [bacterium]|nr:Crp/Fnr family transcriptional regulator [bacterium]
MNQKEKILLENFLKSVPIFRSFSEDNLQKLIKDFQFMCVDRGDDIVFQDDEGTDLYIVIRGRVKVSLLGMEGNDFTLASLKEGDFFGEMSLIDGKARSANVIAEEDTCMASLKRDKFLSSMNSNPVIAIDLLNALVQRLRKADDLIETLAFLGVSERLAKYIYETAKTESGVSGRGTLKMKKRTHQDLASNIGSSREAVSKALKVLMHKNLIQEKEGYLMVAAELTGEIQ